jgi:opacity protein-like surface antigen
MAKANFLAGTLAALLLAGLPVAAQADETADSDWSWRVAPMYLWAPSIKTDLKFDQPPDETSYGNGLGTEASLDLTVFELAGVWSPGDDRFSGFEAFAGLRYIKPKIDAKLETDSPSVPDARLILDKAFSDFMVGARYTAKTSARTEVTLRADASLGETGGTENFSAMLRWNRTEKGAWVLGYRLMNVKLDTPGTGVKVTQYGPVVGYEMKF